MLKLSIPFARFSDLWSHIPDPKDFCTSTCKLFSNLPSAPLDKPPPLIFFSKSMWNYAGVGQEVIRSYGEASNAFMRQVRARYDPTGVFSRLVPGGFKL